MNRVLKLATTIGAVGSICLLAATPSSAMGFLGFNPYWTPHRHYVVHHNYYPSYGPGYGYAYPYGYGYDPGYGLATGLVGGVFGTILGTALSHGGGHVWRCQHTYRSYLPSTNTFMGYDGIRHACVL